jgi:heme-degrading monooxygenase HmoA
MKRRSYLAAMLGAAAISTSKRVEAQNKGPIQLQLDLPIDPKKEKAMLDHWEKVFKPIAKKQPGFIDVKLLKLRSALRGKAPAGASYRFAITYQSEEQRQTWIKSKDHVVAWDPIEAMLLDHTYALLLYDIY